MMMTKTASIPVAKFVAAVVAGRKAGQSNGEIAKSLGMNVKSFGVRVSNTNTQMQNATATYKVGDVEMLGEDFAKKCKIKIEDLQKEDTLKTHNASVIKQGRRLPGSDGVTRTRTNWSELAGSLFDETAEAAEAGESSEAAEETAAE
jgi:hypothetical protein